MDVENFIINESENVYILKTDLQSRYYYFLDKINTGDLLSFIIDLKFEYDSFNYVKCSNKQINNFIKENKNELHDSLVLVNRYLCKFKPKLQINYDDWDEFCYKYTT